MKCDKFVKELLERYTKDPDVYYYGRYNYDKLTKTIGRIKAKKLG